MSTKRKNDDLLLTRYDETPLFRLYRWLRWHKIQVMKVQATSEECLAHLQWLVNRSEYKYDIQTQEQEPPHQFQVEVTSIRTTTRNTSEAYTYTSMGTVVGTIVKDNRGEARQIIVFRAYPGGILSRLGVTAGLLFAIRLFGVNSSVSVAMSIAATIGLIFLWSAHFSNRSESLELVTGHFLALLHPSDKTIKSETELEHFQEEEPHERHTQTQK